LVIYSLMINSAYNTVVVLACIRYSIENV
jgi:hypothetical protein